MGIPLRVTSQPLSVLLIEDEVLISLDLCDTLVKAGYEVLGPAHTVAGALFLLRHKTPHLAIVDILLRDGLCTEIAHQLRARGVPFVIHSGYGRQAASTDGFADAPFLAKPASPEEVVKLLSELYEPTAVGNVSPTNATVIEQSFA